MAFSLRANVKAHVRLCMKAMKMELINTGRREQKDILSMIHMAVRRTSRNSWTKYILPLHSFFCAPLRKHF